ncbi:HNH endonuclease [Subtercola vilae]|uniref:HNH endonuclease n=1 Tax=Subtercola vilae TaxID=2056433 RepID=A0A4T2BG82_9MICO|nr:HNH endonuclease [Subtercola vilae]TIH29292.1 HNH endonuclease [Subtercola vilae]
MARQVKRLYKNHCQVCNEVIPGLDGRTYSEGAHVKPLGRPHLGGDVLDNMLCLCPNHHTQLDIGGMVILDDMSVVDTLTKAQFATLRFTGAHRLDPRNAEYHRSLWAPLGNETII